MPMSRYELRNEYSLADPELYRAADKDDPEALLEGVAMAGLVGVLRQLGDLAEFAAEIFHDLHEEVMVTAARGHGLMIRVQELEAEVPCIEKTLLSQTDHSSSFYNPGVDWHPNMRMSQNLITQVDLPRFIMDSYEECRGPPRLFLLDKFDVGGAGACLKRYTDPSFFKVETSGLTSADLQRDKKIRKAKKKGSRWKHGETPEVLPASHAKLHQLFLNEHVENGITKPARRAKLKRKLNGFPFDSKTGKSYMEKLLRTPSPDHKVLDDDVISSSLVLPLHDYTDSGVDVLENESLSQDGGLEGMKRSQLSPDSEPLVVNPSMYEDISPKDKISEASNPFGIIGTNGVSSTLDEVTAAEDKTIDGDSKTEGSFIGSQSDDISSEIDNYVDAPSTIGSEIDTDSELRVKGDITSSYIKNKQLISGTNEDHLHTRSSDSQSSGESTMSDEGVNVLEKEISSFTSTDSPSTSGENLPSERRCVNGLPSTNVPEIDVVDALPYRGIIDEGFQNDLHAEHAFSDDTCRFTDTFPDHRSDLELRTSRVDLMVPVQPSDPEIAKEGMLREPESVENTLDDTEETKELGLHPTCSPSVSDSDSQSGDDSLRCSAEMHAVDKSDAACTSYAQEIKTDLVINQISSPHVSDSASQSGDDSPSSSRAGIVYVSNGENILCTSTLSDAPCHTKDLSAVASAGLLLEDDTNQNDICLIDDVAPTLNDCIILSQKGNHTPEMICVESPGEKEDEVPYISENVLSDLCKEAQSRENTLSAVLSGEKPINELDHLNVSSEDPNHSLRMTDASSGEVMEASFSSVQSLEDLDSCYPSSTTAEQIGPENLISQEDNSHYWPRIRLDSDDTDIVPEEETKLSVIPAIGSPESLKVGGLQDVGITDDANSNDSAALGNPRNIEEIAGALYAVQEDGIPESSPRPEIAKNVYSEDMKLPNEGYVPLDEPADILPSESSADLEHPKNIRSLDERCVMSDKTDDFPPIESEDVDFSEDLGKTAEPSMMLLRDGITSSIRKQVSIETGGFADVNLLSEDNELLDESFARKEQTDTTDMSSPTPAATDNMYPDGVNLHAYPDELVEGLNDCLEDSGMPELENDLNCLSGSHRESCLLEKFGAREVNEPDPHSTVQSKLSSDHCNLEELDAVPITYLDPVNEHSLHIGDDVSISSVMEQSCLDTEQDSFPENDTRNHASDAPSFPVDYNTEGTLLEKIELPSAKGSEQMQSVGEISSRLSVLFPNNQQMPNPVDNKVDNNSGPTFPSLNDPKQLLKTELPGINYTIDASGNPMDRLGSIFPQHNLFRETNHINLDEVPPLPPLPPIQWRIGKFQFGLSTADKEVLKQKELIPETISPPSTYTNEVSSLGEEANHSLVQTPFPPALKEGKIGLNSSVSVVNSLHETVDLRQKIEDKQQQQQSTLSSNDDSLVEEVNQPLTQIAPTLASQEDNIDNCISSLEIDAKREKVSVEPETENQPLQAMPSNDDAASSNGENNHSSIEILSKREPKDLPPLQLVMPSSEIKFVLPAEEDGVQNGSGMVKLPRPRNPLIDAVAAIDKGKLRKVSERIRPEVQKVDEKNSILEQIRTKSFNLKPTVASRPSFRGPGTNLKVAAILEKANAIRQALTGSDEDDEDSWSDS